MTGDNFASASDSVMAHLEKSNDCAVEPPPPGDASLELSVASDFASVEKIASEWDSAVERLSGPIYMTYDWVKTWWDFYGQGKELRLFIFRHRRKVVALFPIFIERFGFGPISLRLARLIGANIPPKTFDPPVDAAFAAEALRRMFQHLIRNEHCELLSLGPVSARWPGTTALGELPNAIQSLVAQVKFELRDVQTWFRLPSSFEEYVSALGSSERKNRMKRIRHLEKDRQVSADVVAGLTQVEEEFNAFVRQHARQWAAIGKSGHFAAWPQGEAYNRALVRAQARHQRVRFYRMLIDGHVVSNRYTFVLGNTLYSELPARETGEPWDKLGIGSISLVKFNQAAIEHGISAIDSGLGNYEHKAQLGGDQVPVGVWRIVARGANPLKVRAFQLVSRLIILVFHKLWYRRVLPHLPACFPRVQNCFWLRYDY